MALDYTKFETADEELRGEKKSARGEDKSSMGRPSQVTVLIGLASELNLFHDPRDGAGYAELETPTHREIWPIASKRFKGWLSEGYFGLTGRGASRNSVGDAVATIESMARYRHEGRPVYMRVAASNGNIYIDLVDPKWRAIEVTANGWRVLDRAPVMFIRRGAMAALPEPERGGGLSKLWGFINVAEADRPLVAGWLLAALRPTGPYPVLILQGEQETAKSTATRLLRSLVDPSAVPLKAPPRDEKDFLVGAINNWCVTLDNLSGLIPWLSDALCRLATGGGLSARQLYTDLDEITVDVQRPCILNGIDDIATRPDLASRSLILNLEPISDDRRRDEGTDLLPAWERDRPKLFGALCDALACALRNLPHVRLAERPRMADFASWVTAAEPALGWKSGTFMTAYRKNLKHGVVAGLESSPVGQAVLTLMDQRDTWAGTPTALLSALREYVDELTARGRTWPQAPRGLSNALRRLAPSLRRVGIEVDRGRGDERYIALTKRHVATDAKTTSSSVEE